MTTPEWNKLSEKVNVVYLLADLSESLILEIEKDLKGKGELKFEVKHLVNQIKNSSRLMVQHVDKYASVHNDNFAKDADRLKELIDQEFLTEKV
jgi:hypothetical protein